MYAPGTTVVENAVPLGYAPGYGPAPCYGAAPGNGSAPVGYQMPPPPGHHPGGGMPGYPPPGPYGYGAPVGAPMMMAPMPSAPYADVMDVLARVPGLYVTEQVRSAASRRKPAEEEGKRDQPARFRKRCVGIWQFLCGQALCALEQMSCFVAHACNPDEHASKRKETACSAVRRGTPHSARRLLVRPCIAARARAARIRVKT